MKTAFRTFLDQIMMHLALDHMTFAVNSVLKSKEQVKALARDWDKIEIHTIRERINYLRDERMFILT